jgi:2-isopropylmalate synthase
VPIHSQYPLAGHDAFRTATGVHAAAIIKAEKKGDAWLADRIYSGVPAGMFGKEQSIEIGHYSGESNVIYWLRKRGYDPRPALVEAVLAAAKSGNRVLSDDEITAVISSASA